MQWLRTRPARWLADLLVTLAAYLFPVLLLILPGVPRVTVLLVPLAFVLVPFLRGWLFARRPWSPLFVASTVASAALTGLFLGGLDLAMHAAAHAGRPWAEAHPNELAPSELEMVVGFALSPYAWLAAWVAAMLAWAATDAGRVIARSTARARAIRAEPGGDGRSHR